MAYFVLNNVAKSLSLRSGSNVINGRALLAFGVAALMKFPEPGLRLVFIIAVFFQGISYLTAPALALVAECEIRCRRVTSRDFVRDIGDGIPYAQEAAETGSLHLIKN